MTFTPKTPSGRVLNRRNRPGSRRSGRTRRGARRGGTSPRRWRSVAGYFASDQAHCRRSGAAHRWRPQRGACSSTSPSSLMHRRRMPIAAASAVHAGIAASIILISTIGLPQAAEQSIALEPVTTRLVFIATPGPGGGGGGGGLRQKAPPPRAQRKGKSSLDSPVPVRKAPKPVEAAPKPEPPPPPRRSNQSRFHLWWRRSQQLRRTRSGSARGNR